MFQNTTDIFVADDQRVQRKTENINIYRTTPLLNVKLDSTHYRMEIHQDNTKSAW